MHAKTRAGLIVAGILALMLVAAAAIAIAQRSSPSLDVPTYRSFASPLDLVIYVGNSSTGGLLVSDLHRWDSAVSNVWALDEVPAEAPAKALVLVDGEWARTAQDGRIRGQLARVIEDSGVAVAWAGPGCETFAADMRQELATETGTEPIGDSACSWSGVRAGSTLDVGGNATDSASVREGLQDVLAWALS
jgi:hypothetical protein